MGRRGGVVALAIAIWSPETPLSGDPLNEVLRFKPRPTSILMCYPGLNHALFLIFKISLLYVIYRGRTLNFLFPPNGPVFFHEREMKNWHGSKIAD